MAGDGGAGKKAGALYLLDGMSLAFRAYFALPTTLTTSAGTATNAVQGFASMLLNIVRDHHPSAIAVAWDMPGGTFRDDMVEEYKAGRAETPTDLLPQFDMILEVLAALNVPVLGVPGYEADDILATLATQARERGHDVVLVTGDRDSFQLVEDPHIRVLYNRRGVSDYALYDEAGIVERTGVTPDKYPMLAALRGDPSDNLPGVPGVGEKTAAKLLNTYGDLDGVFCHLDELTPKLRQNLTEHEAQARANLTVIPLVRDVPVEVGVDDLTLGGWDKAAAGAVFDRLEIRALWRRMSALLDAGTFGPPADTSAGSGAGHAADPAAPTPMAPAGAREAPRGSAAPASAHPGAAAPAIDAPALGIPAGAKEAVAAVGALAKGAAGAVLAVAARWDGVPGRSPLRGVAAVVAGPPAAGTWLPATLLADAQVAKALTDAFSVAPVAGHHVKELMRSLLPQGIDCRGLVMDTAVAAFLLDPSAGDYSLPTVERVVFGRAAGAAPAGAVPVVAGQLALGGAIVADDVAAAAEAAAVAALVGPLRERLGAEGLLPLHDGVEVPLVRVLARMEVLGIRVDVDELRRITEQLVADTRRFEAEIHRLAGHEFNVNSTPQLRTVLFDELGLTPGRKTKTGFSTDAATLESLRDTHPIIDALLSYREVEKLRSTYGDNLMSEVAEDGRIHASFRQTVARTGRLSSERPNLHNIPVRSETGAQFRRAFVPAAGHRFLVADYDQIELRVIAHLSGDPGLVRAFATGADVHSTVASGIYGVPVGEVTHEQRSRAKSVSYGLAYGMEAYGLARRLGVSVPEANEIMERYFTAFPSVRSYMESAVAEARAQGFTRTELGRIRPIPELTEGNRQARMAAERQAMNAGIQGLAADLFKNALVRLDHALADAGLASRLVLQVHDEVIVEAVPEEEVEATAITRTALTGAADLSVPLEISLAWGDSWAEAKGG
jgi:DNA polymerase-1